MTAAQASSAGANGADGGLPMHVPVHVLTVAKLEAWLAQAQPGARICYYRGCFAGEGNPILNDRLQTEAARGMLYLVQRRRPWAVGGGFDYLAIRSSRPAPGSAQALAPNPRRVATLTEEVERAFARGRL